MAHDPCMFCGSDPCNCTEKAPPKMVRKSLPKTEPVAKPKSEKPPPKQRAGKPQPLQPAQSAIQREDTEHDDDLARALKIFDYFDMLCPEDKKKYEHHLAIPKATGRLVEYERGLIETEGGDEYGIEHEGGGDQ